MITKTIPSLHLIGQDKFPKGFKLTEEQSYLKSQGLSSSGIPISPWQEKFSYVGDFFHQQINANCEPMNEILQRQVLQ